MASGSFNISRTGSTSSYITFKCNWSSTSNGTSANSSNVTVNIIATKSSSSSSATWGTHTTSATVDGSSQSTSGSFTLNPGSSITLFSKSYTVSHNADGTKSTTISVTIGGDVMFGSGSSTIILDKIPRQAVLISAPNFNDEENPTIAYSNPAGNSVNSLRACISLTGSTDDISYREVSKTESSYTFILTEAERNILRSAMINTNSRNVKFYLQTIINDVTYNSILDRTLIIVNGNPTFLNFTYRDSNKLVSDVTGDEQILVKGVSTLVATISTNNKMIANKKAIAKNYISTIDDINVKNDYVETDLDIYLGTINSSGDKRLSIRAYDSRNNSTLVYKDVIVYDYDKPVINATVTRLNNFENQTTLKVSGTYSRLMINNNDKNTIQSLQYRYREKGGTWGNWINLINVTNDGKFDCEDVILSLDNTKAFEFEIQAVDKLQSKTIILSLGIGQSIFFISSNKRTCYINDQEIITYETIEEWEE